MFFVKQYLGTVQEAEAIRTRVAEIKDQIARLEEEREGLTGAPKAKVTRQLTPLQAELSGWVQESKNRYPAPMEPTKGYELLKERLTNGQSKAAEKLAKLKEDFLKDPINTVERGKYIVEVQTTYELFSRMLESLEGGNFLSPFHALLYVYHAQYYRITEEAMRVADRGADQSTNVYSTAVERDKAAVKLQWLRWDFQYAVHELFQIWDRVAVHYALAPDEWAALVNRFYAKKLFVAYGGWNDHSEYRTAWAFDENEARGKLQDTIYHRDKMEWEKSGSKVRVSDKEDSVRNDLIEAMEQIQRECQAGAFPAPRFL